MKEPILSKLKALSQKWLVKIFSDVHSAIVGMVVLALISSIGVVAYFFQTLWLALITAMQLPTPLWLTIVLALVAGLYIFLNKGLSHSSVQPKPKTCFFTTGKLKWNFEINGDRFKIDKYPYCVNHDVKFIFSHNKKYCPGTLGEKCDNYLSDRDEFKVYESVKSIVEGKLRNGEKLC